MTIENKESILRRIQKLLAIASDDRADPNEAAAAAGMAEKVMRKYQIDHAELIMNGLKQGHDLSTEDVVATAKTNGTKVKQVPAWAGWIAVAVSKFTECSASIVTTQSGEKAVRFYGFTEDVKLETELEPFVLVFKCDKGRFSVASYYHYPARSLDQVFGPLFLFEGIVIFFYI